MVRARADAAASALVPASLLLYVSTHPAADLALDAILPHCRLRLIVEGYNGRRAAQRNGCDGCQEHSTQDAPCHRDCVPVRRRGAVAGVQSQSFVGDRSRAAELGSAFQPHRRVC